MIEENKIILNQRKIILKIIQDFKNEIQYVKFKVFPMGKLIKVRLPKEDSNKLISTSEK